jgi:hypothetical protein
MMPERSLKTTSSAERWRQQYHSTPIIEVIITKPIRLGPDEVVWHINLIRTRDHPTTKLLNRNLRFVVKIHIGKHKVAKTLSDIGATLNLIMRPTYVEMNLLMYVLHPVKATFHDVILGTSTTPFGKSDLMVVYGARNKWWATHTFQVADFNIGYNCILRRHFLLNFMEVIHSLIVCLHDDVRGSNSCLWVYI